MATSGLYGATSSTTVTYFEWFVFQQSATAPATPTGGSWNFATNTGTPPAGWSNSIPSSLTNPIYASIAFVDSRFPNTIVWSTPGLIGSQGPTGPGSTVTAGTTTTGAAGTSASVVNSGTSSAAVFDFTIPRGDKGDTGAGVAAGGTTGQVLAKASNTDYDTSWINLVGGLAYQGNWNASTNTPTLTSSTGTNGFYYTVSVAGSTDLNGITDWQVGDWAIFNGTIWQKIDQTNQVTSVNGQTGAVVLTAADVAALSGITSADGSITVSQVGTVVDLAVSAASPASTLLLQVRNNSGATMTKGTVVYVNGAVGQLPTIAKALATSDVTSAQTQGLITADIPNNSNGYVTIVGLVTNIDTSAYTDGDQLYLSGTVAGGMTATKPYAPTHLVYVGVVTHAHPTQGKIQVKVQNGYELDELHNVSAQSPTTGQTIVYNSATSLWEKSFAPVISGTTVNNTVIGGITPAVGTFTTVGINCPTTDATFAKATNINAWVYSGKSKSVIAEESNPSGVFFKPDGTKMYITGSTGDDVNEYTLATAWDVSTATYTAVSTGVTQDTAPNDLSFKSDGLTMFVLGNTNDTVYQYTLSVAWSITTATYATKSFSVTTQEATPTGMWMKPDGTTMYIVGTTADAVFQYTLATPWDISTASYASKTYAFTSQEATANGIAFSNDGSKMYITGQSGDDIWQYDLATPWDVTTATPYNNFYIGFQDNAVSGIYVDSTAANRVYVVGTTNDTVYQYDTESNAVAATTDKLFVSGNASVNGNFVAGSNAYVDGTLVVQGTSTLGTTTVGGTLSASSTITLSGTTTSTTTIGTSATTGTVAIGGTTQTGAITVGQSTGAQTLNLATGATLNATTKAVNIGTTGVSGSTTNINIGSAVSGSLGTTTIQAPTVNIGQTATQFQVTNTASAVNYVQVTGAATGARPAIIAQGSDTNAGLQIVSKGTGTIRFDTRGGNGIGLLIGDSGSATNANYIQITGAATTISPTVAANGSDTNIDLALTPKGTGVTRANGSALSAENGIIMNSATINTNVTVATGYNAHSIGPITVSSGVTITVASGQTYVVI